jgi:hypothetical protein
VITLLATAALAGAPLTMTVPSDATKVVLDCGTRKIEAEVVGGKAQFAEAPEGCTLYAVRPLGKIAGPGDWACTPTGCTLNGVIHAPISDAAGRINVVIAGTYDTKWLELTCSGAGYRERGDIATNTSTFNSVPAGDCTLYFKGATPAQYRGMSHGSWRCSLTGTTAVCSKFTP